MQSASFTETAGVATMRRRLERLAASCGPTLSLSAGMDLAGAALGDELDMNSMSELFDAMSQAAKQQGTGTQLEFIGAAAVLNYLPTFGSSVLLQFLDAVFLPLLTAPRSLPTNTAYMQVARAVCELLVAKQCWPALTQLLHRCTACLSATAGGATTPTATTTGAGTGAQPLPFHTACCLIPGLMAACCSQGKDSGGAPLASAPGGTTSTAAGGVAGRDGSAGVQPEGVSGPAALPLGVSGPAAVLLGEAVEVLLPPTLVLLRAESGAVRSAVLRVLLPCIMTAARELGAAHVLSVVVRVEAACVAMLGVVGAPRRSALAALVQLAPLMTPLVVPGQVQEGDRDLVLVPQGLLFDHLTACLGGSDTLDRKRAVHLLQQLLPAPLLAHPCWQAWVSLYQLLEEFGMHLIKPAWGQMNRLHPANPEHAGADPMPAHISGPRKKLRSRRVAATKEARAAAAAAAAGGGGMEAVGEEEGAGGAEGEGGRMDMAWMCVLWQRAFQHINPKVQRLALVSFLQRAWSSDPTPAGTAERGYTEVPVAFVLEVLLPSLVSDTPLQDATSGYDCQLAACQWLASWLSLSPREDQRAVCEGLVAVLSTKGVPHLGLRMGAEIMAGCVHAAIGLDHESDKGAWATRMLSSLIKLCTLIHNHQLTSSKQASVYACVLSVAPVLAPVPHVGCAAAMQLINCIGYQTVAYKSLLNPLARLYLMSILPAQPTKQGGGRTPAPKPPTGTQQQFAGAVPAATSGEGGGAAGVGKGSVSASVGFGAAGALITAVGPPVREAPAVEREAEACQQVLHRLLTPWQEVDAVVGSRRMGWEDVQVLRGQVQSVSLLCLIFADLPSAPAAPLLSRLTSDLPELHGRAYVPAVAIVKRLLLLQALARDTLLMLPQWPLDTPMVTLITQTVSRTAPFLSSYTKACLPVLLTTTPAALAAMTLASTTQGAPGASSRTNDQQEGQWDVPGALQQHVGAAEEAAVAQVAVGTAAALTRLTAQVMALTPAPGGTCSDPNTSPSLQHLEDLTLPLRELLEALPSCRTTLNTTNTTDKQPLAKVAERMAYAQQAHKQVQAVLLAAVHQACDALGAACAAVPELSRRMSATGRNASRLVQAVMVLAPGEQDTGAQSGRHTAPTFQPDHHKWPCLDAILSTTLIVHHATTRAPARPPPPLISFHDHEAPRPAPRAEQGSQKAQATLHTPPSLTWRLHVQLVVEGLDALGCLEGDDLVPVMRCVRRCWVALMQNMHVTQVQELTAAAFDSGDVGEGVPPGPVRTGVSLSWRVVRAVCSALAGCGKRRAPLCAATVNTLLTPQLFAALPSSHSSSGGSGGSAGPASRSAGGQEEGQEGLQARLAAALHSEGGPVPWALKRLMDWSTLSPRIALLTCGQLSSVMTVRPAIMTWYSEQLSRLLLASVSSPTTGGSPMDSASDPLPGPGAAGEAGAGGEGGPPALRPQEARVVEEVAGTDLAPRVVLLCGMHQAALQAGCVWFPTPAPDDDAPLAGSAPVDYHASVPPGRPVQPPPTGPDNGAQGSSGSGSGQQHRQGQQQGQSQHHQETGKQQQQQLEVKRPVIIFHDTGDWEEIPLPASNRTPSTSQAASTPAINTPSTAQPQATSAAAAGTATGGVLPAGTAISSAVHAGLARLGSLSASLAAMAVTPSTAVTSSQTTSKTQPAVAPTATESGQRSTPSTRGEGVGGQACTQGVVSGSVCGEVEAAGLALWQRMLDWALHDPQLSSDKFKFGSELHRRKVRLWQALCVLTSWVRGPAVRGAVAAVLSQFTVNEAPSVKQYQEIVAAALLVKQPELVESELLPLLRCYHRHHPGVGSFILVAAQVALHVDPGWRPRLVGPLLLAISPWLTCHTHNVRTFAQLLCHALLVRYPPDHVIWGHQAGDLNYLRHFLSYCDTNTDVMRLRRTLGAPLLSWSPDGLVAPARLLGAGSALAGQPECMVSFEGCAPPLMETITTFLLTQRYRLREEMSDRLADIEYAEEDNQGQGSGQGRGDGQPGGTQQGGGNDFQRKVMSLDQQATIRMQLNNNNTAAGGGGGADQPGMAALWEGLVASGAVDLMQVAQEHAGRAAGWAAEGAAGGKSTGAGGADDELRPTTRGAGSRQELIVVASLVDKVPNLAGLARTCEVFRAAQLIVPDIRVSLDPLFSSISVTAEQWVPMAEVKEAALLPWLERKRQEGYTLVGLEQTADSVRLPQFTWPQRAVLVLGREREGMPPEVMQLLDDTVEIPQLGLIRSLNVHVSGAIAMYEYTKQQLAAGHPHTSS